MRFSVIIPLYNKAPYIKKALDSVKDQTFKDYELIVVDDGSTDDSYNVAKDALDDSGLSYQLIRQDNSGVSTARNNGVAASHGGYLCFLDADDWWAPNFLERMDWLIKEYPEARIFGTNYYYVKNSHQRIGVTTAKTGYINYCRAYAEKLQMPMWTGAICIPNSVFNAYGGFRSHISLGEDFDLWIKIALDYKVAFLDEPLSYYYQDSDPTWRLVGKLHAPIYHVLWNLGYLENEEKNNPEYKVLIDRLRTRNLLPYYLSQQYREDALQELAKVDWTRQPKRVRKMYNKPILLLRFEQVVLRAASFFKQWIIRYTCSQ